METLPERGDSAVLIQDLSVLSLENIKTYVKQSYWKFILNERKKYLNNKIDKLLPKNSKFYTSFDFLAWVKCDTNI